MKVDDGKLLKGLMAGQQQSLQLLYHEVGTQIIAYVKSNSGTPEEGEQYFRLAVLRAYEKIRAGEYNDQGNLPGYLFGVARNAWLSELRQRKRKMERERTLSDHEFNIADEGKSPEEKIVFSETTQHMHHCVKKLSEKCRQVLTLHYFEEKRLTEIAEYLGQKDATIRKRHFDCLKKIRSCMEQILD